MKVRLLRDMRTMETGVVIVAGTIAKVVAIDGAFLLLRIPGVGVDCRVRRNMVEVL